jgi:hypothetical protein
VNILGFDRRIRDGRKFLGGIPLPDKFNHLIFERIRNEYGFLKVLKSRRQIAFYFLADACVISCTSSKVFPLMNRCLYKGFSSRQSKKSLAIRFMNMWSSVPRGFLYLFFPVKQPFFKFPDPHPQAT